MDVNLECTWIWTGQGPEQAALAGAAWGRVWTRDLQRRLPACVTPWFVKTVCDRETEIFT